MLAFLTRRLAALLFTLLAVSVIVFLVLEVLPGDPALLMLGTEAQPDTLAALRAELGLDRPAPVRYARWLSGWLAGDLGVSYTYDVPVATLLADRLEVTLPLALLALLISTAVALPLGMLAAARRGGAGDWAVMGFSQLGLAIPSFWFGIVLTLIFSVRLGWFASGGFPGWEAGLGAGLHALVLPAVALAATEAAILARVARSALLEASGEDYVRTARAKGLSRAAVLRRHVLRNALIPVVTIIELQFGVLMAGAIVVENVFYLPGLGRLLYQAVGQRDLIVVRNVVVLVTLIVIAANFLIDLLYVLIDPRPRTDAA